MRVAEARRPPLKPRHFEVIIIGGGVNGVAIARECALAGKRTLLLEQHDFASGTSSRSTRIIHGGLRYLEHGELGLVRESLRERERLLCERPHLVRPLNFLLAVPKHGNPVGPRSALAIRAGLLLYRRIAHAAQRCPLARSDRETLEASLDAGERWTVFNYEDAQCEFPERLIAEWLVEALRAGLVARNHTAVLAIRTETGAAKGVITRDMLTGLETEFEAEWVINAAGPWVDRVCAASTIPSPRMIGGVRGSHIVLPHFPGAPNSAVYAESVDGRQVFVIPWNGQVLVGSTEVKDDGDPARAQVAPEEVQYLFSSFRRIFPDSSLQLGDVISCFAGIRPLPYIPGAKSSGITRKHFLRDHSDDGAQGLISVIGGKLTTAASLARECARKIGLQVPEPITAMVASGPASGLCGTLDQWAWQVSNSSRCAPAQVSAESARAIAEWHGRSALDIVRSAMQDPLLAERLCPHTHHLVSEAVHAIDQECAIQLGDILLRRVPVALGPCWREECGQSATRRIGRALGWSALQMDFAREEFEAERSRFMQKIQPAPSMFRNAGYEAESQRQI